MTKKLKEQEMTNQIDSYPHAAIRHLVEHHLGDVMRALVQEIESMTSDMGYYFDNKDECDAFDAAADALKRGLCRRDERS